LEERACSKAVTEIAVGKGRRGVGGGRDRTEVSKKQLCSRLNDEERKLHPNLAERKGGNVVERNVRKARAVAAKKKEREKGRKGSIQKWVLPKKSEFQEAQRRRAEGMEAKKRKGGCLKASRTRHRSNKGGRKEKKDGGEEARKGTPKPASSAKMCLYFKQCCLKWD